MKISFITQAIECKRMIDALAERASNDDSQFSYTINQAKWSIDRVVSTYQEVIDRDTNEDHTYRPIKEVN